MDHEVLIKSRRMTLLFQIWLQASANTESNLMWIFSLRRWNDEKSKARLRLWECQWTTKEVRRKWAGVRSWAACESASYAFDNALDKAIPRYNRKTHLVFASTSLRSASRIVMRSMPHSSTRELVDSPTTPDVILFFQSEESICGFVHPLNFRDITWCRDVFDLNVQSCFRLPRPNITLHVPEEKPVINQFSMNDPVHVILSIWFHAIHVKRMSHFWM